MFDILRDLFEFGLYALQIGRAGVHAIAAFGDFDRLHVGQDHLRRDDHLISVIDEILRRPFVLRKAQREPCDHREHDKDRYGKSGQNARRKQV